MIVGGGKRCGRLKITQLVNSAEITGKKFMEEVFMGWNSIHKHTTHTHTHTQDTVGNILVLIFFPSTNTVYFS